MSEVNTEVVVEETEGLGDRLAKIDLDAPLSDISIEDRKSAFDAKSQVVLDELKEVSADTALPEEDKKKKIQTLTEQITAMKNEYVTIGMTSLIATKNEKINRLRLIQGVYVALLAYAKVYTPSGKTTEELVNAIYTANTINKEDGTTELVIETLVSTEAINAYLDGLAEGMKTLLEQMAHITKRIESHEMGTVAVQEILDNITSESILEKAKILYEPTVYSFKKKTFATFCKKKINNKSFHDSIKKDEEYFGILINLFMERMDDAITEEYVSNIFDVRESYGISTKAEFIEKMRTSGEFTRIAVLAALYMVEFVQKALNDNTLTELERTMYLNSLFTKNAYVNFRINVIRYIFLTLDSAE